MRKIKPAINEYYHILNRGNNKQNIFLDQRDWIRFLFLVLYFQSPTTIFFNNISRPISHFVEHSVFNIGGTKLNALIKNRYVELVNFTLMPNHFHLLVKEIKENGISNYMQRVLNAYTKYFNTKYEKTGHLFQGPFKIVHIKTNEQLLHLSAYIHRNPREIKQWFKKEDKYPWSSYQDYINKNRWDNLLRPNIILNQFSNLEEYKKFVETSPAKLSPEEKHLEC